MSAIDILRTALYGSPPSQDYEPDRDGVISAFAELYAAAIIAQAAAAANITIVADTAARDAFYADEANQGKLVYVNNNNGASDDPANGVYEYVDGAPRIAEGFYQGVSSVVQPLVDEAAAFANEAKNTFKSAYLNTGVGPYASGLAETVIGDTDGADSNYGTATTVAFGSTLAVVTQGFLKQVSVRLTAAGPGKIQIVGADDVLREEHDFTADAAGVNTVDYSASNIYLRTGDRVFYKRVAGGGNLLYLASGGPGSVNYVDPGIGETVSYSSSVTTPSIAFTVLSNPNSLAAQTKVLQETLPESDDYQVSIETDQGFILYQVTNDFAVVEGSIFDTPGSDANAMATGVISGAVTDKSFIVAADIQSAGEGVTELEVATDEAFTDRTYISPPVRPYRTAKSANADYRSVKIAAEDLRPDTPYYYRLVVDGVAGDARSLRTFPAASAPAAFTIAVGCCNPREDKTDYPAFASIAAASPLLFFHIGDIDYSNIDTDDIRLQRAANVRDWRSGAVVAEMLKTVPMAYMFDNHDSGPPSKDVSTFDGTTWPIVLGNSQRAAKETFPFYPLAFDDGGLAQEINIGSVRFMLLDCTSYRKATDPNKTMLGAAQMAWLEERLTQAGTAGLDYVFIISTERFENWGGYPDIHELANFISGTAGLPPLTLIDGDIHYCGVDDGGWVDAQEGGTGKLNIPLIRSSGLALDAADLPPPDTYDPLMWNGVASSFPGKSDAYVLIDVAVDGSWTARIYSEPYTGTDATLLGSYSITDLA